MTASRPEAGRSDAARPVTAAPTQTGPAQTGAAPSDRAWLWYLAGGLVLVAATGAIPATGGTSAPHLALYLLISASAVVAIAVGRRLHAPAGGLPWWLFAAAQATSVLGDAMLAGSRDRFGADGFPGLGDACHLARYPLLMAGLTILARRRGRPGGVAGILDSLMMAVAGVLISWFYLVSPRLAQDQPPLVSLVAVAYPVLDLVLFAASLRLLVNGVRRPPAFYLIAAHLAAVLAADIRYVPHRLDGDHRVGGELDVLWLAAVLFLGAAALHPSMSRLGTGGARPGSALSVPRLFALTAAALVAPVVLAVQSARGETSGLVVVAAASAVMFILIIFRMAGLVADQHQAAITDVLTGLHTRRHLEGELSAAVDRALRDGTRLGLFLIDVDHFKAINDRYGHLVGDGVLVEVARRLRAATRPGDVLGRYGGEEFAVLVTNLRETDLASVGERLRRQVGGEPIRISARRASEHAAPAASAQPERAQPDGALTESAQPDGGPVGGGLTTDGPVGGGLADPARNALAGGGNAGGSGARGEQVIAVTVSVGAAAVPTHAGDPFQLFGAADDALYAAKSAGRDRVAISGRTPPPAGDGDELAVSGAAEAL